MAKRKEQKIETELVYGIHPIVELLKAKRRKIVSLYTTKQKPKAWALIESLVPLDRVQILSVTREALTNMAGTTDHQGVVAWVTPYQFRKQSFTAQKHPFLLMLDGIQDTRNLGAIIRSAYCAGVNGIIMTQKNSATLNASALKASAGLAEHIEILMAPTAQVAVQILKKEGYRIYLATVDKSKSALQVEYATPLCLVIGGEGAGISRDILDAGTRITIPQRREDISYNASVAAGILLFLVATQSKKLG